MNRFKLIIPVIIYFLTLFFLVVYSYSQIDLNLTLSSNGLYQSFQKQLIYLGYFNRPLSTLIYTILVLILFLIYCYIIKLVRLKFLSTGTIIQLILLSILFLFLSYPAFSHDIFNYLFDDRIVTKYFANPYIHKALDFPSDPWIRFMHWTHRTYPYGPVWLIITLPFSFLGFGKFTISLLNFKLMFVLFHLGNIFLISKILEKISPKNRLVGISFYAFNPLILIESLVSPHNETMMLFFLLLAVYEILIQKKLVLSIVSLSLSAGIKFITLILLPLLFLVNPFFNKNRQALFLKLMLVFLLPFIIIQTYLRTSYPWYFITVIGAGSLVMESKTITTLLFGVTFGGLLYYIPYLYIGYYASGVTSAQIILFVIPVVLAIIWLIAGFIREKIAIKTSWE